MVKSYNMPDAITQLYLKWLDEIEAKDRNMSVTDMIVTVVREHSAPLGEVTQVTGLWLQRKEDFRRSRLIK